MTNDPFSAIPADRQEVAIAALAAVFGRSSAVRRVDRMTGGASGALIYRAQADDAVCVMRLEGPRRPFRNPHQYACMEAAAQAGIAPPIRYLDPQGGVVVMDCVATRPLSEHPSGVGGVVRELGALLAGLQQTPPFPELHRYPVVLERLLAMLRENVFAPGLLDAHADGFARVRDAYPWDADSRVSSHNDPNPHNILFDGQRLWLVDWETAYRNDPWVDAAIVAENYARTAELEDIFLRAWLGGSPDVVARARLRLMRVLSRLYYAGLLLMIGSAGGASTPITDLAAPTEDEFRNAIATGALAPRGSDAMITLGKMQLAAFVEGVAESTVAEALQVVRAG